MTTVGFIGLGIMGGPMAANLVKAGYSVVGYNRHPEPIERLVAAGGRGASGVAEAVAGADVVITMLPDSPDVQSVALGEDGVFANAKTGLLYIDASTIRPDVSADLAAEGAKRGIGVVDAPVSGGAPEDFAAARPVLETVGKTVVHVGPPGAGQTVKAANQLIVAGTRSSSSRRRSRSSPVVWPATRSSTGRPPTCWTAASNPASGSTCTTRTSGSCRRRRGRPV